MAGHRPDQPASRGPPRPATTGEVPVVGHRRLGGRPRRLQEALAALPAGTGMAFILIQHLDPTHESMMVDLLAGHTPMTVRQAADGMPLERDHVYVIPPGAYLSVARRRPAPLAATGSATARACRSTSSCARWRRSAASAPSA